MFPCVRPLVLGVVVGAAALLPAAPAALADPWKPCAPHSLEDETVHVFPRAASPGGPTGTSSALQCGNRYYGLQRIETEWTGVPDWPAAVDAAIGRALTGGHAPEYDRRSNTWTIHAPGTVVVLGPRGLILDALPAAP